MPLCVYNGETLAPNNLVSRAQEKNALPQKSLMIRGGGEHFPALDNFLELPLGLLNGTGL